MEVEMNYSNVTNAGEDEGLWERSPEGEGSIRYLCCQNLCEKGKTWLNMFFEEEMMTWDFLNLTKDKKLQSAFKNKKECLDTS